MDILKQNKKSWDIVAHHFNGKDALPSYGPYAQTEDELRLFEDIQGKNVLDIGCGSGHSLRYMGMKGAKELWGIDISDRQIKTASEILRGRECYLYCSPMEMENGLPKDYFDYVYSIYGIGWTTDLAATFHLVNSYLKPGGIFIFSWDHPLYSHMKSQNGTILLEGSYQEEGVITYPKFKGEDAPVAIPKRKMSTYINELIKAEFLIDTVIESEVSINDRTTHEEMSDRYYSLSKAKRFPTTMIIKARKK